MNKGELISQVARSVGSTQLAAEKVINAMFESITTSLQKGDDVRLFGFGSFAIKQRPATTARNPRTGENIQIPSKRVVKFSPVAALKEAVALGSAGSTEATEASEPEVKTPKVAVKADKPSPKLAVKAKKPGKP